MMSTKQKSRRRMGTKRRQRTRRIRRGGEGGRCRNLNSIGTRKKMGR